MTLVTRVSRAIGRVELRDDAVRRLAIAVLLALGVASIVVAAWSLAEGGIGWDSTNDTAAALQVRSVDSSSSLTDAYSRVPSIFKFYGLFLYQFADVLHLLTTGVTEPLAQDDPTTYLYQGAATLFLSVASVTALGIAITIAFRSLLAGSFVWSLTLATPLWLGMSHVDFKDMPVAAGITLVNAGLMLSICLQDRVKATLVGVLVAGAGGAITLGTRAGALVLLAVFAGGTALIVLAWSCVRRRPGSSVSVLITSGSVFACGFTLLWATNPFARINMLQWLRDSAEVALEYPWSAPIRVAGRDVLSVDLPWWYVPAWLVAQLPLLTLAAVVGGLAVLIVGLVRRRQRVDAATTIPLVPIALQAVIVPATVVLSGAVLYDGIRHLLFMIPGLIAIPAVALALLDRRTGEPGSRLKFVLPLGAVVIVAASLWASIRWAPYAYAFVNPAAGYDKKHRSWELDYWGVSGKEGLERLKDLGYSPVYVQPSWSVGVPYGATDGPIAGANPGLYVFLRRNRATDYGCTVIFTIERDGHELGEGARCPTAPKG